jgi:hypothetical protein
VKHEHVVHYQAVCTGAVILGGGGQRRGESFLQEVKPLFHNMIANGQYNVHVEIHKEMSLRIIMRLNSGYLIWLGKFLAARCAGASTS